MVQFINSWIQKITYMWRKWGATQNFCLTSIYELEKQLLKKLLNWAYKKCKNFNIYMLKKKEKRKTTEDIIILHLCTYNLDDMICSSWDIKCDRLNLVITGHFLPFPPLITWKTRILKKFKKWLDGDIIILHMCTENHDHKKYSSRDTERDRQDFLSFWAIFCSSSPLTTQKMKSLKKRNKYLEVWSFYTCAPKIIWCMWCMFLEIWSASDKKFCRFGPFFALLPHYWPWKLKFGKNMVKNTWRYYPFANVYH